MPAFTRRSGLPAAAFLLLVGAAAPRHPLFAPAHDVSVTYRLESPDAQAPGGRTVDQLHFRAIGGGQLLRLDTSASGAYLLIDRTHQTATVVDPKIRAFLRGPLNPKLATGILLLDPNVSYQRAGSANVAGLGCEIWKIGSHGTAGTACVTADGVVLSRTEGGSPAPGSPQARSRGAPQQARLTALSVTYGAQPKTLFAPPSGFQDLSAQKAPGVPPAPLPTPPIPGKSK